MGDDIALINGFDTENVIIPVASLPYYKNDRIQSKGSHRLFRFANGYGLSVIPDDYDDDFDAFVIKFTPAGMETLDFSAETIGKGALVPDRYDINYTSICSNGNMTPWCVSARGLSLLCKHVQSMNSAGRFQDDIEPANFGQYYDN